MADHKVGKLFVELDLDPSRYLKANQQIYKSATQTSLDIEKNFKNLGIKSDSTFNLMRAGAQNSFNQIVNSTKASANDRVRAEEAMAAKFKSIHEQQFGHQTTLIESMKKNWMAASAVAISAYYAASKFYDLAERGAKVTAVEESFTAMSKNFGVAGDALIKKMEEVTKNTIDNSDLMAKAVRLISEGFSEKQIVGISEAARVSARLTGKTISEAYDSISDSILNLRERGLKTAGIIIDMDKAERQYAATLNVTKDQLNDYGRRMAWAAAIMEKTKEDTAKLGESLDKLNDFEQFQKRTAVWKEFGDKVGKVAEFFVNMATAIVDAHLKFIAFQKSIREWGEKKIISGMESVGILSPRPSQYFLSEKMTRGEPEKPSQIKIADPFDIQKKLNELQKEGLSIGYQTFEQKIKILDIEKESSIQELKKQGMGELIGKVWENYRKKVEEIKKVEQDRLSGLEVAYEKIATEADNLSQAGKMPDWRESLDYIEGGWIRVNGELRKSGAYIPVDQIGRLDVAMQALLYDTERLSQAGEMPDWRESLEDRLPKGFAIINGEMKKFNDISLSNYRAEVLALQVLETRIAKEKELRDARVSLGWMRPAVAGLAGLEDEKKLLKERLSLEEKRLGDIIPKTAEYFAQEDKITDLKRQQAVLDASRLRYISETASASEGLFSAIKKYDVSLGTPFTKMEDFATKSFNNLESALSDSLAAMLDNTTSFAEAMKSIWKNLATAIIKNISDIIAKQLTAGITKGVGSLVGGIVGAVSGIGLGSMTSTTVGTTSTFPKGTFQHGTDYVPGTGLALLHKGEAVIPAEKNIFAKKGGGEGSFDQLLKGSMSLPSYQHGTDYVPKTGPAFLHAGEMVIPESKSKGGKGDTYLTIIEATDVESFTKRYGPVIEGIYHKGRRFNKVAMR